MTLPAIIVWKSRGCVKQRWSSGNETIIDRNDYESYGSENQSKCDSGPAVWLFPDIKRTVYFHQRERDRGRREAWRIGWLIHYFAFPRLPQLGFTRCSWYSWSKHIIIIKHVLGSQCKQRHNQAIDLSFHSTVCGLFTRAESIQRRREREQENGTYYVLYEASGPEERGLSCERVTVKILREVKGTCCCSENNWKFVIDSARLSTLSALGSCLWRQLRCLSYFFSS